MQKLISLTLICASLISLNCFSMPDFDFDFDTDKVNENIAGEHSIISKTLFGYRGKEFHLSLVPKRARNQSGFIRLATEDYGICNGIYTLGYDYDSKKTVIRSSKLECSEVQDQEYSWISATLAIPEDAVISGGEESKGRIGIYYEGDEVLYRKVKINKN